ncbi:phosphoadenosine phosphosulfate reductase [unidentified eubacterium SCB49]|nr:phosphoadenosine phosphosulfate reductase [unidentified eubacterium SCB49]
MEPEEIIQFALHLSKNPLLTTSFGKYSACLIHAVSTVKKDIAVLWCDTGYNTDATYEHVSSLSSTYKLNLEVCSPQFTTAYINNKYGAPEFDNPNHHIISEITKVAPFQKAIKKIHPDVWLTNLRKDQNPYRESLDILSYSEEGILKVAPFFNWSDSQILSYMNKNNLPIHVDYFDPIKASQSRECGIHFS